MMPVDGWTGVYAAVEDQYRHLAHSSHHAHSKESGRHRAEGYEQGADSYITKPFHSKVLLARVEISLHQRAHLRQLFAQGAAEGKETEEVSRLDDRDKAFVKQLHDVVNLHMGNSDFGVEDMESRDRTEPCAALS